MPDSPCLHRTLTVLRCLTAASMAVALLGCAGPLRPVAMVSGSQEPVTSQNVATANHASPRQEATASTSKMPASALRTSPAPERAAPENAAPESAAPADTPPVRASVRGQSPDDLNRYTPGSSDYTRYGMRPSGAPTQPVQFQPPPAAPYPGGQVGAAPPYGAGPGLPTQYGTGVPNYAAPGYGTVPPSNGGLLPAAPPPQDGFLSQPGLPPVDLPSGLPPEITAPPPGTTVPWDIYVQEARTGQFMVGVGVNSDAGVTGQIVLDERNFDWRRVPTSWDDIINGTAWRGAGQGFRLEAVPGNQVQRYLVSFTEPYLFDTQVSLNLSGFFYDRRYFDWDEQRLGGRVAFGYRLTPDLSFTTALRMENINVHDPRVVGVQALDEVIGDNALFSPRFTLTHDTRDVPFLPTEGHYIELSYEQVFGDFDYPRGEFDFRKYFLVTERPDGSGRHTLSFSSRVGISGSQTPIFENYFAGGYSTLRGFDFRGASPVENTVRVGGEFRFLGAVEYMFPLTADDMIRGVAFVDFGTVEEKVEIEWDDFRVAPGLGLRISIPALGPAPIALDFAVPVAREDSDDIENFSFFFGFGRS